MFDDIAGFDWVPSIVEKLIQKHGVEPQEAEECFFNPPFKVRRDEARKYLLYGRTEAGRYLLVVYAWSNNYIRVVSARDMTAKERNFYARK